MVLRELWYHQIQPKLMRYIYCIITCDDKTNTQRVLVVVAVYTKKFQRELTKVQS